MLLKALLSSSIAAYPSSPLKLHPSPAPPSPLLRCCRVPCFRAQASSSPDVINDSSLAGVVFQPFLELQDQLVKVSPSSSQSLARQRYSSPCEAAINEQIHMEYNVSYMYHTFFAYFDRDNVALPGLAKFFKDSSDEEREHAEKLMKYQTTRGGRVKLQKIVLPNMNVFDNPEQGDALFAMELALALEMLVNEQLLKLHKVEMAMKLLV